MMQDSAYTEKAADNWNFINFLILSNWLDWREREREMFLADMLLCPDWHLSPQDTTSRQLALENKNKNIDLQKKLSMHSIAIELDGLINYFKNCF